MPLVVVLSTLTACNAPEEAGIEASAKSAIAEAGEEVCDANALPFGGGNGTADSPNLICSVAQLKNIVPPYHTEFYALTSNLDLSSEANWKVLGQFFGQFDGRGYTLTKMKIRRTDVNVAVSSYGLFSNLAGLVKNLNFSALDIDVTTGNTAGAVAGGSTIDARIENVYAQGGVKGAAYIGGLIGQLYGRIDQATFTGVVRGTGNAVGGLVGITYTGSRIRNGDASLSSLLAFQWAGRVVGSAVSGDLQDCTVSGFTSSSQAAVGLGDAGNCL